MMRTFWTLLLAFISLSSIGEGLRSCFAPPRYQQNAALREIFIGRKRFYSGTKASYDCARGFRRTAGSHSVLCTDGRWQKLSLKCQKGGATCSTPTVAHSVQPGISVHQPGDILTFTCAQGFQLVGEQLITCGADGQWKPLPPQCLLPVTTAPPGRCGKPSTVYNKYAELDVEYVSKTFFSSGDKVYYNCPVGYRPAGGSSSRRCEDGEWSPLKMTCERKLCGSAGEILNGEFIYSGNEFGDTATAECNEGYMLVGRATRRCKNEGWDGHVPECEDVVCDDPPEVKNAEKKGLYNPPHTYLSVVRYNCIVGSIVGPKELWCTKNGTWSAPPPVCTEGGATCSTPTVAHSVQPGISVHQPGDILIFTCAQGFQLVGEQLITCGADGQWKPLPPQCLLPVTTAPPGRCGKPSTVYNKYAELDVEYVSKTFFSSGDKVYYNCPVGYRPAGGSSSRRCEDGEWSPLKMTCERKLCGSAGEILNGEFIYSGNEFGDTATAECNEGYMLVGRATRRCRNEGWDGHIPECEDVVCDDPPEVKNAEKKGLYNPPHTYLSVVRYNCIVGSIVGPKELWCTKNGTWSTPPPACTEIICKAPKVPNAYWEVRENPFQDRDTIWIRCNRGYKQIGPSTLECKKNGQWGPALPKCLSLQRSTRRG